MSADGDDPRADATPPAQSGDGNAGTRPLLRRVHGPIDAHEPPPPVTLRREWKGLTVADVLQEATAERLPGRVRSALQHLERGDLAAAERALPGDEAPVLAGPGHHRAHAGLALWVLATATVLAALAARWF